LPTVNEPLKPPAGPLLQAVAAPVAKSLDPIALSATERRRVFLSNIRPTKVAMRFANTVVLRGLATLPVGN